MTQHVKNNNLFAPANGKILAVVMLSVIISFFPSLLKAQVSPSIEWQKSLGGTSYESPNKVIATKDGGYLIIGQTQSNDGDVFNMPKQPYAAWIIKLDTYGNILWNKCIDLDDVSGISDGIETNEGGILLVGWTRAVYVGAQHTHGRSDALLVKLNPKGDITFWKTYGGSKDEYATAIVESKLEGAGYVFVGNTFSNDGDVSGHHPGKSGDGDSSDVWMVNISYSGDILWQKCLGGDSADYANSIITTPDRGFLMTGWTRSASGDVVGRTKDSLHIADQWLVKFNSAGEISWQKFPYGGWGGYGYGYGYGYGWYGGYGGYGYGNSGYGNGYGYGYGGHNVINASDGGYLIIGSQDSSKKTKGFHQDTNAFGGVDAYLAHLNSTGDILWERCYGGYGADEGLSIIPTKDGGYLFTGFSSSVDEDVIRTHNGSEPDNGSLWVVKLKQSGDIEWQRCFGGKIIGGDVGIDITESHDGKIVVASTSASVGGDIWGPHWDGINDLVNYHNDIWVIKLGLSADVKDSKDNNTNSSPQLYPNPSGAVAKIQIPSASIIQRIEVFDLLGAKVNCASVVENNTISFNVESLPSGTYIAHITYNNVGTTESSSLPLIVKH